MGPDISAGKTVHGACAGVNEHTTANTGLSPSGSGHRGETDNYCGPRPEEDDRPTDSYTGPGPTFSLTSSSCCRRSGVPPVTGGPAADAACAGGSLPP
jgi:hypothetical protein